MAPLSTPARRAAAQAVRFVVAGGTVNLVYIGLTLLFSGPMGVPIQVAILVAYVLAVCLHFVLQRHFVFQETEQFALSTAEQIQRYVVIGLVQYTTTALSTTLLPDVVGASEQVVYVVTAICISITFFVLLRTRVFHPAESAQT